MQQRVFFLLLFTFACYTSFGWGFYAHREINYHAAFLLPPAMLSFYKPNIDFIAEHAVDPDKRRYAVSEEGCRHYIDLNRYGAYPFDALPRQWNEAVEKFGEDSIKAHGIVPWWVGSMLHRLTVAFRNKNYPAILRLSAEIGHYIADAHVPLHAHSNYNGQQTGQHGIHGLWESRIPELLAAGNFNYFIGKARYISSPEAYIWKVVLESAAAADTVLLHEKQLTYKIPPDQKYAYENRSGLITRQYSAYFTTLYNASMNNMVERRMRESIFATASFWYTAWVNAGQPVLDRGMVSFSGEEMDELNTLDREWKETGDKPAVRCPDQDVF
ncbi:MAG: S1/P1 Nuclease [Chitinophagaceae bacterium]|nr:S1/P1 Nuclease [Chitinophagaceae bacterium]MCW5925748.1 S1/P1 Nuclease [Chitinophagaceae bacterium]